jgi:DNA-binding transcriptional LysR family regulator
MELRHLRYFVAVAEELHFGRAARRLRMSQPPLSQQIAALERELGVRLFERGRRTALTHAGRMMLPEARATLERAERAAGTARRADRGEVGSLSVGFVRSAAFLALPVSLRAFREEAPDVELSLHPLSTLEQLDAFEEGGIDVGFLFRLPGRPTSDWLSLRTVAREPLVAGLPQGHPLARKEEVPLVELSQDQLLLMARSAGAGTFDSIVALCRNAGFEPDDVREISDTQTVAQLVAAGVGVSLHIGDPQLLRSYGVAYRAVDDPEASWELAVACRNDDRSPVVETFLGVIEERAESLRP